MGETTKRVKGELSRIIPPRRCCRTAELSSLLHVDGTYKITSEGHVLITESAEAFVARKIYRLMSLLFRLEMSIGILSREYPVRRKFYTLAVHEQPGFFQAMNELGILNTDLFPEPAVPARLLKKDCCKKAALRGAFLGGGYLGDLSSPAIMEIFFEEKSGALVVARLFRESGIKQKLRYHNGRWVVYLKSRERISSFLRLVGAHGTCLELESQMIMNATKSDVNRKVNCDSANARRIALASNKQRESIMRLKEKGALGELEEDLLALVELRLRFPQASLAELGRMAEPPVSKSVVQKKMEKLIRMSEGLR